VEQGPAGGGIGVTSCDIAIVGNTIAYNHSQAGGGIHLSHSNSILQYNTIRGNSATGNGGGVEILGDPARPAVVSFLGDTIEENLAGPGCGGINAVDLDSLVVESVVLRGNRATWGGGIGAFNSSMFLTGCVVEENSSSWLGGGIAADYCELTIVGTEFRGNVSQDAAGAMHNDHCTVLLSNASIVGNVSGNDTLAGPAGGINAYATTMEVQDCEFRENVTAGNGGALCADSCTLTVSGTVFGGNTARFAGGGIHGFRSNLDLQNSSVTGNAVGNDSVGGIGGGLRTVGGSVDIRGCQIDSNRSTGSGGGIATLSDDLVVDASSLSRNRARWSGGGVAAGDGNVVLSNSEMVGNVAGNDTIGGIGGGVDASWSDLTVAGCTISADTANTGAGLNIYNCDLDLQDALLEWNFARENCAALNVIVDSTLPSGPLECRIERTRFEANEAVNLTGGARIQQSNEDSNQVAVTIDGCVFVGNRANANAALRVYGEMRGLVLTNSLFLDNTSTRQSAGAGVTSGRGIVSNCLFAWNTAGSDTLPVSSAALSVIQGAQVEVVNCTFTQNDAASASALGMRAGALVWLTNCIMAENTGLPISLVSASSATGCELWVNYSLVEQGADSVTLVDSLCLLHWGAGNIDEDPLFENSGIGDFRLNAASPCIGAGIDSIDIDGRWYRAPVTDLEGNPRPAPAGTRPDMGAYEDGITVPVGVEESGDLPIRFALYQNYPNPFNPETTIRFDLPEGVRVRLEVFDLLGARVAVLIDEVRPAGRWSSAFRQAGLASGVYILRFTAGSRVFSEKMMLLR
jgi:predicted outer membrane repeat protein